ncbi:hypothetical protein BH18ACT11_BH18ACT11_00280 [soil metagenome]
MRVLVTVSPRIYREAVAFSLESSRPDLKVRVAPPEDTELELAGFRPHLLVHNDTAPIPEEALTGVPCSVEIIYSDSMDARVRAGGALSQVRDMSTEDLLRTAAVAETMGGLD